MKKYITAFTVTLCLFVATVVSASSEALDPPVQKQTALGLYLTAAEAYAKWLGAEDQVTVVDVRTQEEYMLVGHAPMAHNIPVMFLKPIREGIGMAPNPDFVTHVEKKFPKDTTLLVMCRSGARSAMAINKLAAAGFTRAYNIIDGFEGDMIQNKQSYYHGRRMVNGWKNSGAPWTYDLSRPLLYLP